MKRSTLVLAALLVTGGGALADSSGVRSSAYCCNAPTWSGVYAGFQAGGVG